MAGNIAEDLVAAQRLQEAVRMRVKGHHWSEIAQQCGYASPAAALKAVGAAMADATMRAEETADSMRDTANLRLEHLLKETLGMLAQDAPMDLEGNQPDDRAVKLRAVDEGRRLIEAITKLNGVSTPNGEDEAGDTGIRIVLEERPRGVAS